jgi:hypothetical protein
MKVYPAPGLKVRDPETKTHLPAHGADVDSNDLFWARRLRDGDVVTEPPELPAADDSGAPETSAASDDIDAARDEDDQS